MLLKTLMFRILLNPIFEEIEKDNARRFILYLIRDSHTDNPQIYTWKSLDHTVILRNFEKIKERFPEYDNIDINMAYNTILVQTM